MTNAVTSPAPVPVKADLTPPLVCRFERLLQRRVMWWTAIAFLATLQAVLIFTHRPWMDEWQALQIAIQSPTIGDLLANLHYEGHPPLWYLILRGASAFIPVYSVLPAVVAAIAIVTVSVIVVASPFSRLEKLSLISGELILFEYLTLSRSLSLGVCVAILALALRRSRWGWIPIALLPMCDFLFGVLSAILIVIRWREARLWIPDVALWLASAALAAWSVLPAPDFVQALKLNGPALDFYAWVYRLGVLLVPFQTVNDVSQWNGVPPFGLGLVLGPLFLVFAYFEVRHDRLHLLILAGFVLTTLVLSVAVYPLHARHLSLIALLLILLKWRDLELGRPTSLRFRAWLATGAACGLAVAAINLARPFDTADAAAKEIYRLGLQNKRWFVFPDSRAQGVSALTGMEFERLERGCTQSFIRWNYRTTIDKRWKLERYLRATVNQYGRVYLLTDYPIEMPADLVRVLSYVPAGYDGQKYYLNLVGPDAPEREVAVPRCAPANRRPLTNAFAIGAEAGVNDKGYPWVKPAAPISFF